MKIWKLSLMGYDSCGECQNPQEEWFYDCREKAEKHRAELIAQLKKDIANYVFPRCYSSVKELENNLEIEEINVQ